MFNIEVTTKEAIKLYCVIQEIELKKENAYGASKELEAYKTTWSINGVEGGSYGHRYTGGKFERPIKKAYKISIHESYRENGKVKKKQWSICTMSYYDLMEFSLYDCGGSSRVERLSEELNMSQETIYNLIYSKLDPLIEQIKKEYESTEEYKTHKKHKKIIDKYNKNKKDFEEIYGNNTYDYYYDVFGVLREEEKFEALKRQREAKREYQRSYYDNFKSNHNSYSNSSYSAIKQSNYTDTQKEYLKKIYRAGAKTLHPDVTKDDGAGMKFLNELKENWGI